ncbi:glycosyltransferase family protein [Marinivivus vitaminiproducens]|uniref:glycosyltransferase family protein n=1 Tax=Marinivivus vitaminiproducens TaxID=3035935 RepID=UPI0027A377DE|nr:glycosyltransferase [Geminicoccaceae bacterium SCSIO 64248]
MSGRVLLWCQHLLGTGHLKRATTLAAAMSARGLDVTLASGGPPSGWLRVPGVRIAQLPWLRSASADFSALRTEAGVAPDDAWWRGRVSASLAALDRVGPDIVMTEMFPFGRRLFARELVPLLEAARARAGRPWVLASVRDVLVEPKSDARHVEMAGWTSRYYDRVLVHSDPALVPFGASFRQAEAIADRILYTGFVLDGGAAPPRGDPSGEILVSTGGGAVGADLLRTALAARPLTRLADAPWRLIGGGNLAEATFAALGADLPRTVVLERHRDDFQSLLSACRLSVSQAGYNTVLEVLRAGRRAVFVPFGQGRETEQRTRAARVEAEGRAVCLAEAELSPERLAEAVDRADALALPPAGTIDLEGASRTAAIVAALVGQAPP